MTLTGQEMIITGAIIAINKNFKFPYKMKREARKIGKQFDFVFKSIKKYLINDLKINCELYKQLIYDFKIVNSETVLFEPKINIFIIVDKSFTVKKEIPINEEFDLSTLLKEIKIDIIRESLSDDKKLDFSFAKVNKWKKWS